MTEDIEGGERHESRVNEQTYLTKRVLSALDRKANDEIEAENDGKTSARVVGPAYRAILSTLPEEANNTKDMLVNRLWLWTKRTQRAADRIVQQGVEGLASDPDFAFQKVVSEDIYPFELSERERQALKQAAVDESERQRRRTQQTDGMAISIKVRPERMLAETLMTVRDALQAGE